jgi:xanthine dehydrogenase YagR molybdenum-binding subunit
MPTIKRIPTTSPIGRDTPRIDGPLKVSGTAHYASDFYFLGLLCGVPVEATIAKGKITKLDTAAAESCPACARFCIVKTSGRFSVRLSRRA